VENKYFHPLNSRYRTGYSVATALIAIGWIIRVLGIGGAIVYLLFGIFATVVNGANKGSIFVFGLAFVIS